jgi:hypothetical protein
MGTGSRFQDRLEAVSLPSTVHATIWLGDQDTLVDATLPGFARVRDRIGASVKTFPGETHTSIIDRFAHRE